MVGVPAEMTVPVPVTYPAVKPWPAAFVVETSGIRDLQTIYGSYSIDTELQFTVSGPAAQKILDQLYNGVNYAWNPVYDEPAPSKPEDPSVLSLLERVEKIKKERDEAIELAESWKEHAEDCEAELRIAVEQVKGSE